MYVKLTDNVMETILKLLHLCLTSDGVTEAQMLLDSLDHPHLAEAKMVMDQIVLKARGAKKAKEYYPELTQLRDILLDTSSS